jgi:hypothetical protein
MQKYISRISDENLEKFMVALNKIAIEEGLEDVKWITSKIFNPT